MARIRTIKPDFFRHERLQDLEAANPGQHVMLVFAALWGHCDKAGNFAWKPRLLKLDILPFLDFDLSASLMLLWEAGLLERHEIDGEEYGFIPTFVKHQRVSGKEAKDPPKYPDHKGKFFSRSQGSTGEAPGKQQRRQEGKGREGNYNPSEDKSSSGGAPAPVVSFDSEVYRFGKSVLGPKSGGVITKLRQKCDDDLERVMDLLVKAQGKEDPSEWIGAIIRGERAVTAEQFAEEVDAQYRQWGVL